MIKTQHYNFLNCLHNQGWGGGPPKIIKQEASHACSSLYLGTSIRANFFLVARLKISLKSKEDYNITQKTSTGWFFYYSEIFDDQNTTLPFPQLFT